MVEASFSWEGKNFHLIVFLVLCHCMHVLCALLCSIILIFYWCSGNVLSWSVPWHTRLIFNFKTFSLIFSDTILIINPQFSLLKFLENPLPYSPQYVYNEKSRIVLPRRMAIRAIAKYTYPPSHDRTIFDLQVFVETRRNSTYYIPLHIRRYLFV